MSSLINTKIEDTYTGLLKTSDNLPIDATLKTIQDGNGGNLPIQVSTTGVNFTGTVTGLPANGVASITAGSGIAVNQTTGNVVVSSTAGDTTFILPAFTVPASAPSDICYAVVTIPANTFANGDILEFRSLEKRDSLNNTCYESYWFSEAAQTAGQAVVAGTNFQQAGIQTPDNGSVYYQKTLWIDATNTTVYPYGSANETSTEVVQGGDPVENQAVDWSVTQYFYYQGYNDSTTGSVENYGTILRKLN